MTTKTVRYAAPMAIGDKQVVRIRPVTLMKAGGMRWVGYRITHPRGRRPLTAHDFAMRDSALLACKVQGWTVLGSQS